MSISCNLKIVLVVALVNYFTSTAVSCVFHAV